jgi:hypothetical protein
MADKKEWGNAKYQVSPDHIEKLERYAAIHQYGGKKAMAKDEAEKAGYDQLQKELHLQAAAHHYARAKAAQAMGQLNVAHQHSKKYQNRMESAGIPYFPVPSEVKSFAHKEDQNVKFVPHEMDTMDDSIPAKSKKE